MIRMQYKGRCSWFEQYQFNYMDKSNSNSQPSNFFVISSQSSRSTHPKNKKYVRFAKKVQELIDVQGTDLEQVYRRLQIIVKKYFHQHRIVEFDQMYEYIVTLKDNNKKMNGIVDILEQRLCKPSVKRLEINNQRKLPKGEEFQTTTTTQKQTKNSTYHSTTNKESLLENHPFEDHEASVNTSVKQNHVFKPSIRPKGQDIIKQTVQLKGQKDNESPIKSPNKRSFGEQYKTRNKEYELKVKKMMEELQQIKQKIVASNIVETNLRINLKPNQQQSPEQPKGIRQADLHVQTPSQASNKKEQKSELTFQRSEGSKQYINIQKIMSNTSYITQQIAQLKQAASRLSHYNPSFHNTQQQTISHSQPQQSSKIEKIKKQKAPILQKIQNTTSQVQISENQIPSFKYLASNQLQKGKDTVQKGSIVVNEENLSSSNILASYPSNHKTNSYGIQTYKYVYNPSLPFVHPQKKPSPQPIYSIVQPQTVPVQRRFVYYPNIDQRSQQPQINNQRNSIYFNSPNNSSKSSTSILHPHLFQRQASLERNRSSFTGSLNNNSLISSKGNGLIKNNISSSSSSIHRKGLNLTRATKF